MDDNIVTINEALDYWIDTNAATSRHIVNSKVEPSDELWVSWCNSQSNIMRAIYYRDLGYTRINKNTLKPVRDI